MRCKVQLLHPLSFLQRLRLVLIQIVFIWWLRFGFRDWMMILNVRDWPQHLWVRWLCPWCRIMKGLLTSTLMRMSRHRVVDLSVTLLTVLPYKIAIQWTGTGSFTNSFAVCCCLKVNMYIRGRWILDRHISMIQTWHYWMHISLG